MERGTAGSTLRGVCPLACLAVLAVAPAGCEEAAPPVHRRVVGGDAQEGRKLLVAYGCPACHVIPGIRGARGTVGPPLTDFARRAYIAGTYPNRPDLLVSWISNPPAMAPSTAMPNMGVSPDQARHIAAYLYGRK